MATPKFELVGEVETENPPQDSAAAIKMLQIALAALGQKSVIALANLFTAAGLFSAWWLWQSVLPNPSVLQLVGVGMYATFLLILEFVRRRS